MAFEHVAVVMREKFETQARIKSKVGSGGGVNNENRDGPNELLQLCRTPHKDRVLLIDGHEIYIDKLEKEDAQVIIRKSNQTCLGTAAKKLLHIFIGESALAGKSYKGQGGNEPVEPDVLSAVRCEISFLHFIFAFYWFLFYWRFCRFLLFYYFFSLLFFVKKSQSAIARKKNTNA